MNFPALDSLFRLNSHWHGVQCTVATEHPIKGKPLRQYILDPLAITQLAVYFVVPEFIYRKFFEQPLKPTKSLSSKYTLDQWVLKIDLRKHFPDIDEE